MFFSNYKCKVNLLLSGNRTDNNVQLGKIKILA